MDICVATRTVACAAGLLFSSLVGAIPADEADRAGVIGLLPLPTVLEVEDCAVLRSSLPTPVYRRSRDARPAGLLQLEPRPELEAGCWSPRVTVRWLDGHPSARMLTDEYSYEVDAAIVLEQHASRFRIALTSGSAWIDADRSRYRPATTLLRDGLLALEDEAFTSMRTSPGGTTIPVRRDELLSRRSVRLISTTTVAGRLWVKVQTQDVCGGEMEPPVGSRIVWLPFLAADGRPTVWFASRGC